jgi:hypothetical protein
MPKNHQNYIISAGQVDTVPAASATKTGDIEVVGRWVTGNGTEFVSDKTIVEGDWIFVSYDPGAGTVHRASRIERIASDESILLEDAFEDDVPAATSFKVTKASRAREMSVYNPDGGALVDGLALGAGAGLQFAEEMWYRGAQRDFPDPVVVDAVTAVNVLIVY